MILSVCTLLLSPEYVTSVCQPVSASPVSCLRLPDQPPRNHAVTRDPHIYKVYFPCFQIAETIGKSQKHAVELLYCRGRASSLGSDWVCRICPFRCRIWEISSKCQGARGGNLSSCLTFVHIKSDCKN